MNVSSDFPTRRRLSLTHAQLTGAPSIVDSSIVGVCAYLNNIYLRHLNGRDDGMNLQNTVIVFVATVAAPFNASACSCFISPEPIDTQLFKAQSDTYAIYRGQVILVEKHSSGETTRLQVLEVFKGDLTNGRTIDVASGGWGDCTVHFDVGDQWLIYSPVDISSVSYCSGSRRVTQRDAELIWLRTGKLPPVPTKIRRATVRCPACVLGDIAEALTGSAPLDTKGLTPPTTAFHSAPLYSQNDLTLFGITTKRQPFELLEVHDSFPFEACRARIVFRPCGALDSGITRNGFTEFSCQSPQADQILCDENADRGEKWSSPEPLSPASRCNWRDPTKPECALPKTPTGFDGGIPAGPTLRCTPESGSSTYLCHVDTQ